MCGISALFQFGSRQPALSGHIQDAKGKAGSGEVFPRNTYELLDCSVESMRHRGPDAKGVWTSSDNSVGLAHVRLSTRDLSSAGHQPLHAAGLNAADDIHAIVNGELYYETSLRNSLQEDYEFQSTSDSEMVIPLYKRYGADFVEHLRGEFSVVLYDGRTQTLVAARDRFGVKPLHYCVTDGKLMIATQCKGVAKLLGDQPLRWDLTCLAQGGGHYGNRTLFQNIRKVPPGHVAVIRYGQTDPVLFRPYYWTKYPANKGEDDARSAEELTAEAQTRLLEAVRLRLESSDVPVGVLLSGGVDSSALAGMTAHLARNRLEAAGRNAAPLPTCFTIAFPDSHDLDESEIATRTAKHLGLPLEKLVVTEQILADEFDEACWLGETLMWDLQHIAKKALSKFISGRGFKVVLNGDGGDELFGGYPFFAADRLLDDDKRRAAALRQSSTEQREKLRNQYFEQAQWFGAEEDSKEQHRIKAAQTLSLPPSFCNLAVTTHNDWLVPEVAKLSNPFQSILECFEEEEVKEMQAYHPMHRGMLAWNKTILPNMVIAAISDGAEMAHAVESRPPFLDHVVSEFTNTLSVDMLVHLDSDNPPAEKWLFRQAVRPYVTEEVYHRRKQAFAAPFRWQAGGPLHRKLSELLSRDNLQHLGFVDCDMAQDILDRSFEQKNELLFRKALWLAQIVSIGRQFGVLQSSIHDDTAENGA